MAQAALADIRYQPNDVYLHTDATLMPRNRAAWASWNCLQGAAAGADTSSVCVSYWVNLLQNLPADAPDVFVTLNPITPPCATKVLTKLTLDHPLLNMAAIAAQQRLSTGVLQGVGGVWFAGAWCSYGFHEDGIRSAVSMAARLCRTTEESVVPWKPISCSPYLSLAQRGFLRLFEKYGHAMLPDKAAIRLVLPSGSESLVGCQAAKPADLATVRVHDASLFAKVVMRSDIGLGEAYMDGTFDADCLYRLMEVLSRASCGADARQATCALRRRAPRTRHRPRSTYACASRHRQPPWPTAPLASASASTAGSGLDGSRRVPPPLAPLTRSQVCLLGLGGKRAVCDQ